mmetsp:Transcript_125591/g.402153  ORF Transcript_125591/g.402153 Transcript_125591/m.402153 type:complete len:88 (-) Transcript_125591:121-384(-)
MAEVGVESDFPGNAWELLIAIVLLAVALCSFTVAYRVGRQQAIIAQINTHGCDVDKDMLVVITRKGEVFLCFRRCCRLLVFASMPLS